MASGGIAGWRELDPPRFRSTGDPDRSPRPARRPLRNPVPGAGFALSSSNARERPLTARRPAPIDVETSSDSRVWHTGSGPRGRAARPSIGGADSRSAPAWFHTVTKPSALERKQEHHGRPAPPRPKPPLSIEPSPPAAGF